MTGMASPSAQASPAPLNPGSMPCSGRSLSKNLDGRRVRTFPSVGDETGLSEMIAFAKAGGSAPGADMYSISGELTLKC